MYSKTRNTLTALIAASLLVASSWLMGHPVEVGGGSRGALAGHGAVAGNEARIAMVASSLHARHANRMNLAMPYYSFAMSIADRRAD